MRILDPRLAAEPIGAKWYVRSGKRSLVLHTELGPVRTAQELIWRTFDAGKEHDLGKYILCSQSGFNELDELAGIAYFDRTYRFASSLCGIPYVLLEAIPK